MPVKVEFPDGEREVPSRTVHIHTREIHRAGEIVGSYERPIEQAGWQFIQTLGNKWKAVPRW